MRYIFLNFAAASGLTLAAIAASATSVTAGEIAVASAYARASATPLATTAAVYVAIANAGAADDRLVAVSTPAARTAMLHRTEVVDGVARMEHIGSIVIPAGGRLDMAPGGLHIMLMGLEAPLQEGAMLDLTLTFAVAGAVTARAPVRGVAAGPVDQESGGPD